MRCWLLVLVRGLGGQCRLCVEEERKKSREELQFNCRAGQLLFTLLQGTSETALRSARDRTGLE